MSLLDFNDQGPKPSGRKKSLKAILGVGALAGVIALGSTLAASINLNSGTPVEFGQGVAQTTACTGNESLTITPVSIFNNGYSSFKLDKLIVSHIPQSCVGKDFVIRAYSDTSGTQLLLDSAVSLVRVAYNDSGTQNIYGGMTNQITFDGQVSNVSVTDGYGTFAIEFNNGPNAEEVTRLIIESIDSLGFVPLNGLIVKLDAANYSGSGDWLDTSGSGINGVITTGVGTGVIEWKNEYGGVFEGNGEDSVQNGISIGIENDIYSSPYSLVAISRYLPGGQHARVVNAENNWLLGHWGEHANYFFDGTAFQGTGTYDENWAVYVATGDPSDPDHPNYFYINGTLVSSSDHGYQGPSGLHVLGGGAYANEGSHAQVGVILAYNRILTSDEVSSIFNNYRSRFGIN